MATRRPPVIPEIAKAFQNDPRTQLAMAQLATGSSTAPVAQGKYGMADGAARALQALTGAYMTKKQMGRYGAEEADLLALRKARGVDGLNAMAAPAQPPPPMAPGAPAAIPQAAPVAPQGQAVAAATALGAPPPVQTAPAPPMMPPIPDAGGAPQQGRRPFGPSAAPANPRAPVPAYLATPEYEEVPDAPAPVARPETPKAEGPTRSRLLEAAYKIMADANAYESASGQELYGEGLADQTKLDESAVERRQKLTDMGYQADLGAYADAQSQDRSAKYAERQATTARNFQTKEAFTNRMFQHGEGETERQFQATENAKNRAAARINAAIAASSRGGNPKPLPFNAAQKLAAHAAVLDGAERLSELFDKRFVGRPIAGNAQVAINKVFKGDPEMANWWQDYQQWIGQIRHDISGASLTKTETALFNQYMITPAMNGDVAAANLARQKAIVAVGVGRLSRAASMSYGLDGVTEAIGRDPMSMPTQMPATTAPPSKAGGGGWGKAVVVK